MQGQWDRNDASGKMLTLLLGSVPEAVLQQVLAKLAPLLSLRL